MGLKGAKETGLSIWRVRLGYFFRIMGRVAHWGFVPFTIYLGFRMGQPDPAAPEISLRNIFFM